MEIIKDYINIINDALKQVKLPKEPRRLYEPIEYTMENGGKRIRPVLTLLSAHACGANPTDAINQALGLEYFHNFTLLHDDVMDNADVRRNRPTVHRKWDSNTAILSGDAMLTLASQIAMKSAGDKLEKVIELFNTTAMEVYEGQQYDMNFETQNDISVTQYIEMIRLKTSVLLGAACKMGAIMANASDEKANHFYDFGVNLGLAFQLQDDYLDIYGNPETFGKAIGGDILNNKKTFFLTNAQTFAFGDTKTELDKWLAVSDPSLNQQKIEAITKIYNTLELPELCDNHIDKYISTAKFSLYMLDLDDETMETFNRFIDMLMHREK